jgi:hypothetical protein
LQRISTPICTVLVAVALASPPTQAQIDVTGDTLARGAAKSSLVRTIEREAKRISSCRSVDSIEVLAQAADPGAQLDSSGNLIIGTVTERWVARLCQGSVAFSVAFTGNGMLGSTFSVRSE